MQKQRRNWIIVVLAGLILWWAFFFDNPQMLLISFILAAIFGGTVLLLWRQFDYRWRIVLGFGLGAIFIAFVGGYLFATSSSFLERFLNGNRHLPFHTLMLVGAAITASIICAIFLWPLFLLIGRRNTAAETYLSFLLKLFPKRVLYLSWRGTVRQELFRFDEAMSDYRAGIEIAIDKNRGREQLLQMYSNRAAILLWRGQVDAALKDLNAVFDINPNYLRALRVYSQVQVELNDLDAALESAEYALTINPKDVESLTNYADILARAHRKEDALIAIQTARELMPNEITIYTNLSSVLVQAKAFEEAIVAANEGLSRSPETLIQAILIHNRCVARRQLGHYNEALCDYDGILDKTYPAPFDSQIRGYARVEKGIICFARQEFQEAEEAFSQAYEVSPTYAVSLLALAITQYANGEHDAAFVTWEKFRNTPTRFHNLERLEREGYLPPEMMYFAKKMADERGLDLLTA